MNVSKPDFENSFKRAEELTETIKSLNIKLGRAIDNVKSTRQDCSNTIRLIGELNGFIAEKR
jgi:hypothetical protein